MSSDTTKSPSLVFIERILDLSILTYVALIILGYGYFSTVLTLNVQNALSLVLVGVLAIFTWVIRSRMDKVSSVSDIRPLFIQWGVISILVILYAVFMILIYPLGG